MKKSDFATTAIDYDSDESVGEDEMSEEESNLLELVKSLSESFDCDGSVPTSRFLTENKNKPKVNIKANQNVENYDTLLSTLLRNNVSILSICQVSKNYIDYSAFSRALAKQQKLWGLVIEPKLSSIEYPSITKPRKGKNIDPNNFAMAQNQFFLSLIKITKLRHIVLFNIMLNRKGFACLRLFINSKKDIMLQLGGDRGKYNQALGLCGANIHHLMKFSGGDHTNPVFGLLIGIWIKRAEERVRNIPFVLGFGDEVELSLPGERYKYGMLCKAQNTCLTSANIVSKKINFCCPKLLTSMGRLHSFGEVLKLRWLKEGHKYSSNCSIVKV